MKQVIEGIKKVGVFIQQLLVRTIGPILVTFGVVEGNDVEEINKLVVELFGLAVTLATNADLIWGVIKRGIEFFKNKFGKKKPDEPTI